MKHFLRALEYYKSIKKEDRDKRRLLNMKTDFHLFEALVQKCNNNPELTVRVILTSGDIIEMKTVLPEQQKTPSFSGEYVLE